MEKKRDISRREFIKKVGFTTAAVGVSAVVPKFLKPAQAAVRDHILIGRPLPLTGPVSAFTTITPWLDNKAIADMNKDGGIYIKEAGKKLPVRVKTVDTESDPTKAGDIASKLVLNDNIDIMYVSATPATVSPVAAVCERFKIPCVSTMMPVEMFLLGGPFTWAFDASFSVGDYNASFLQMWNDVKTNKTVGLLAQNDPDGVAWADGAQHDLEPAGYKVIDTGRFPAGTMDYGTIISGWKKENVEIMFANMSPPDFTRVWRQAFRENFIPKISTVGRALLFPAAVEAVGGDLGLGTSTEAVWHPSYPFKSSLTGETAKELSESYEAASGKQWTAPLGGCYSGYEIVADVLKRAQTLDKETLRKAFAGTNLNTIQGPTKFNDKNVAVTPSGGLQWVKGKKFPYQCVLVANGNYKMLPTEGRLISIHELRGMK
ncbi:MAG: ABC transporter substrate-binding protein [Thermodesulfobacteriota bacterium]|jgi:branched-chain amino acid transport system substrate-binding protein